MGRQSHRLRDVWARNHRQFCFYNRMKNISHKILAYQRWTCGFPNRGGRYRQVLNALRKLRRVQQKLPARHQRPTGMFEHFWGAAEPVASRCELVSDVLSGVFFLMRVSEVEQVTCDNVLLGDDIDGDAALTSFLPKSKTYQYNEGGKVRKAIPIIFRPARAVSQ